MRGLGPPNMLAIDPPRIVVNPDLEPVPGPPSMLAIDPPKLMVPGQQPVIVEGPGGAAVVIPGAIPVEPGFQIFQNGQPHLLLLGIQCQNNFTCAPVPNSFCSSNFTCQCLPSFIEDPMFPGTCRLAPGYNEPCAGGADEETSICREPFVCNSTNYCDCARGYIQEYFQCVRNCPPGYVPIDEDCYPGKHLEDQCEVNEQCMQSYAQCLHGKCQCIPGANQVDGKCFPVNQCPLGEPAKDANGGLVQCKANEKVSCPKDYYCIYPEFTESRGFCCPKIKMNCPIGKPMEGRNCSNCPWETHHCFSYVIGSYTETMCCPNACPAGQPIHKLGQCYARAAFGGNCMITEQCYNVVGAVCRDAENDGTKKCLCPKGNFKNYFGRCMREPTCPTAEGSQRVMESYMECSENADQCNDNQFCRRWWYDGTTTYSLCCPKPSI